MTLGPRDRVIGQMYIEGDLRVGGTIEGQVEVTGDLEIDDMAKVNASLAGRDVNIKGQVNGAIVARKRLIVARSGSLIGDVHVARLVIQDGATFSGKVSMGAGAEKSPAKAAAVEMPAPEAVAETLPELPAPVMAPPAATAPAPMIAASVVQAPAPRGKEGKDGRGGKTAKPMPVPAKGKKKKRR